MSRRESPSTAASSWSLLNERRLAARSRWPTIWSVPLVDRSTRYAAARIRPGDVVLDVGASGGAFCRRLPEGTVYRTLDVDPAVEADYRRLDEAPDASADAVVCFETIEHMTLAEAWESARGIARALKPGGRLFLSTPNVHHPWSFLRSATHRTPWCYDELAGLLDAAGLAVDGLFRCNHDAALKALLRRLAYPLYRIVGVDWAKSILVTAHRRGSSTRPEM